MTSKIDKSLQKEILNWLNETDEPRILYLTNPADSCPEFQLKKEFRPTFNYLEEKKYISVFDMTTESSTGRQASVEIEKVRVYIIKEGREYLSTL